MTLYLHIGAQKTGSTTIQAAVHQNRAALQDLGLFYPEVEPGDANRVSHYNSMRGFFSPQVPEIEATKSFVARVNRLPGDVLISSEVISNWPGLKHGEADDAYWARKKDILIAMRQAFTQDDIQIILCVRRRHSYLKSLFKQHLKMLARPSLSIEDELRGFLRREILRSDLQRQADLFKEVFGTVHVIDFDEHARQGTLLSAFTAILGRDIDLRDAEVKNVSPDWTDLEMNRLAISLGVKGGRNIDDTLRHAFNEGIEKLVSGRITQALTKA